MNFDLKKLDNLNQPRPNAASQTADVPAQPSSPKVASLAAVPDKEQAPAKPVAAALPAATRRPAGLPKSKPEQQELKGHKEQQEQQPQELQQAQQQDGTALSAALERSRVAKPASLPRGATDLQDRQAAVPMPNQPASANGAALASSVVPQHTDGSALLSSDAAAEALQPAVPPRQGVQPLTVPRAVSQPPEGTTGGGSRKDEPDQGPTHADLGDNDPSANAAPEALGSQPPIDATNNSKAEAAQPLCRLQQQKQQHQEGQQGAQQKQEGGEAAMAAPALPTAPGVSEQQTGTAPAEVARPQLRVPASRGKRKAAVVAAEEAGDEGARAAGPEKQLASAGTQQALADNEAAELLVAATKEPAAKARQRRSGSAAVLSAARAAAARASEAAQAAVGDAQTKGAPELAVEDGAPAPTLATRRGRIIPRATKPKPSERAAARKAAAAARKAAKEAAAAAAALAAVAEAEPAAEVGQGGGARHGMAADDNGANVEKQEEQPATPKKKQPRRQPKKARQQQQAQAQQEAPAGAATVVGAAAPPVSGTPVAAAALAAAPAAAGAPPASAGPRVTYYVVGDQVVLLPEAATGQHLALGADGQLHPAPAPAPPLAALGRKGAGRGRKRKEEEQSQEGAGALVVFGEGSEEAAAQSLMEAARKRADKLARKDEPRGPKRAWNRVMPRPADLAAKDLDPSKMSLKEIVAWGAARDRRVAEEERLKKEEAEANGELVPRASSLPPQPQPQEQPSSVALAPQVHVVDGRIVVNQQSLMVQAQAAEAITRVVREDQPKLNSASYMRTIGNERWSPEDTELFYKALSQFGTDFSLLCHLFPGRQRRHLKNKFNKESRANPGRVDEALKASTKATVHSYKEMMSMLRAGGIGGAGAAATAAEEEPAEDLEAIEREAIATQRALDAAGTAAAAAAAAGSGLLSAQLGAMGGGLGDGGGSTGPREPQQQQQQQQREQPKQELPPPPQQQREQLQQQQQADQGGPPGVDAALKDDTGMLSQRYASEGYEDPFEETVY
ncbi:hypothetical protein N2152v2_009804 [Parachlorella kessleri]